MGTILGVIKHSRLMELKNSSVVDKVAYEGICKKLFEVNRERVDKSKEHLNLMDKIRKVKDIPLYNNPDSFSGIVLNEGISNPVVKLTEHEIDDFILCKKAVKYSDLAKKALEAFRFFDEIYVDSYTAKAIDWLLHNKQKLKDIINEKG